MLDEGIAMKNYKYAVRFADRGRPDFFRTLEEIAEKYDFTGFDPKDHDADSINAKAIELRDEDGSVIAWIVPA